MSIRLLGTIPVISVTNASFRGPGKRSTDSISVSFLLSKDSIKGKVPERAIGRTNWNIADFLYQLSLTLFLAFCGQN